MSPQIRSAGTKRGGQTLLAHPTLNGIDFVEYEFRPLAFQKHVLVVQFLKPLPQGSAADGAYDLTVQLGLTIVEGGVRIVPIHVVAVQRVGTQLEVAVDQAGDFSKYLLALGWRRQADGSWQQTIAELDRVYSISPINFKAGCPVDFDCRQEHICPPEPAIEPVIDYLARDYASFRQLLIDNLPRLNPNWRERNPSDLGIMLLELLAIRAISSAISRTPWPTKPTWTLRASVFPRDGMRASSTIGCMTGGMPGPSCHLNINGTGTVPRSTKALTRIGVPLRGQLAPPGTVIPDATLAADAFEADPALIRTRVFETMSEMRVDGRNNELFIHAWGNTQCCLGAGATSLYLYTAGPVVAGERTVTAPPIAGGDYLLLEEVLGPVTGVPADADPLHRQVVKVTSVQTATDSAYKNAILPDGSTQVFAPGDTPMPLLRVAWARVDALRFPLCLSARPPASLPLRNISVARGNIIPVDHGRTLTEVIVPAQPPTGDRPIRIALGKGPLTMSSTTPGSLLREITPAIGSLRIDFPTGVEQWQVVPDLLDSQPFSADFVAEVDHRGIATLRFGDDEYGRRPVGALRFTVVYRVGNGKSGNLGSRISCAHCAAGRCSGLASGAVYSEPVRSRGWSRPRDDRRSPPDCTGCIPRRTVPRCDRSRLREGGREAPIGRGSRGDISLDRQLVHRLRWR